MVLTSHEELGNTGKKTGFWLEELAAPYYIFLDAGASITLASPKGDNPPLDPKSDVTSAQTLDTIRFKRDAKAEAALAHTVKLSSVACGRLRCGVLPRRTRTLWAWPRIRSRLPLDRGRLRRRQAGRLCLPCPGVLRHVKAEDGSRW